MSDNRLQVRLPPSYRAWLAALGGDPSAAARALLAGGAALLGLEGAAAAAVELLGPQLDRDTLLYLYDKCTTSVRQMSYGDPPEADPPVGDDDPFAAIGIEV